LEDEMETSLVGRGWVLPTNSSIVNTNHMGQIITLTDERTEIKQSIGIILMTMPGERVMRPNFGCHIHDLLFAPNNQETAVQAQRYVTEALQRWEPRITVDQVLAHPAAHPVSRDENMSAALLINIQYTVKATGDGQSLVYPFYLNPGEQ